MKKFVFALAVGAFLLAAYSALQTQNTPAVADANFGVTVALDKPVAEFSLPDASGKSVKVGDFDSSRATVIAFIATRCPVSLDYDARLKALSDSYRSKGVRFFGINSNKQEPADEMGEHAREKGFGFPVLKDAGNKVADKFDAHVTPEIYVVNAKGVLVYKGHFDDSRDASKVKTKGLQLALDAILDGKSPSPKETRAFGCSIKRVN